VGPPDSNPGEILAKTAVKSAFCHLEPNFFLQNFPKVTLNHLEEKLIVKAGFHYSEALPFFLLSGV
jgi:hypothetical protein